MDTLQTTVLCRLLHPWTYQAMIYDMIEQSHDRLLGNNEIKFRPTAPSLQDKDLESIPLSIEQDRFYRENRPRQRQFHFCVALSSAISNGKCTQGSHSGRRCCRNTR